jgi:hypothetical protein
MYGMVDCALPHRRFDSWRAGGWRWWGRTACWSWRLSSALSGSPRGSPWSSWPASPQMMATGKAQQMPEGGGGEGSEYLRFPRVSSALSFIGGVHIGARALHVLCLIWFGWIARIYPGGEGGNFLAQMISTCLPSHRGREEEGGRGRHHVCVVWGGGGVKELWHCNVEWSLKESHPCEVLRMILGLVSTKNGSGSGSFYHQAKIVRKTLIPTGTVLWLLYDLLCFKHDVNVASRSNKQKTWRKKKYIFSCHLNIMAKMKGAGSGSIMAGYLGGLG